MLEVPFVDLRQPHQALRPEILAAVERVLDSAVYVGGPEVEAFEARLAESVGVEYALGVSSGTAALHLALRAVGVSAGDEVITQPNTFIATASAIALAGARPVFVDIERDGIWPSVDAFVSAIGPETKAIIPVHLFGFPYPGIEALVHRAHKLGVAVVEDAAQAQGAQLGGRPVGTFGRAAAFSFYPAKNLGACGDAGAVVSDDRDLMRTVRALRSHGAVEKYLHERIGGTERMDPLQAAILAVKLPHLSRWNAERRAAARFYDAHCADIPGLTLLRPSAGSQASYHLYVVRHRRADALVAHLAERGIATGRHYPVPCHLTPAFAHLGLGPGAFPNAEAACAHGISLPMYPGIPRAFQTRVIDALRSFAA